jgi:hypothetical protein
MVIHHVVFELGKTRGGAGLVLAYVHRSESFGATQKSIVETAEDVTLAKQKNRCFVEILYLEIRLVNSFLAGRLQTEGRIAESFCRTA